MGKVGGKEGGGGVEGLEGVGDGGWELARVQFSRTGIVGVVSSRGKSSYGAGKDYSFWWV